MFYKLYYFEDINIHMEDFRTISNNLYFLRLLNTIYNFSIMDNLN